MTIPFDNQLQTQRLAQVFRNTTATYKFYWFIAILELVRRTQRSRFSFREIVADMVAQAWYPIHYYKLSFGFADQLGKTCLNLQKQLDIPIAEERSSVRDILEHSMEIPMFKNELLSLLNYVPYRFLSPWIHTSVDKEMIERSQHFENEALYAIHTKPEFYIEINPCWISYLERNNRVLEDFCYWNLMLFLQARNPNVPDIANKLVRPIERGNLKPQRTFWEVLMKTGHEVYCIYTDKKLTPNQFDLDHFVPWSYVLHDMMWNLTPSDSSVNSSKSNRLPEESVYLPKMAEQHRAAIRTFSQMPSRGTDKVLSDFSVLGTTVNELAVLNKEDFYQLYHRTFSPMLQIAENMGFEKWQLL